MCSRSFELGRLSIHSLPSEFSTRYLTIQCGVKSWVTAGMSSVGTTLLRAMTWSFRSEM